LSAAGDGEDIESVWLDGWLGLTLSVFLENQFSLFALVLVLTSPTILATLAFVL
jgi:hypothetical protein